MGKRKLVPAALHAELSQYSSLLRALRTSNTLDVTAQLTQHQESLKGKERAIESDSEDGDLDDIDVDEELDEYNRYDNTLSEGAASSEFRPWSPPPPLSSLWSSSPGRSLKRKRSIEPSSQASSPFNTPEPSTRDGVNERAQINRLSRDNWTRWPLLVDDVPLPEWSLQDEIAHIVSFLQRHSHSQSISNTPPPVHTYGDSPPDPDPEESIPPSSSIPAESDHSDRDSDVAIDPPPFLPSLTLTANHLLQRTFAALAFITPPRPPSMQNRLDPIGWETVLEAFALASLQTPGNPHDLEATHRIVEKVRQRMEVIYGPSQPKVRKHLRPTLGNETSSPVRVISTPAKRMDTMTTAGNAEGSLSILDGSIDVPTQPPPSTPRRARIASPPRNSSLPLPAAPDASFITHRLQIVAESRKQLAGSLSMLGASTSSLFDVPALETSNTKARLSRPRARKSVPPKRGPQVLVASSSITSHISRRKSRKTNLKKRREGNEGEEDDVVAEQEPMDSEEDEHSSQGSEQDIEDLDGEEQLDDQEERSTSRRKHKRTHKYAKKPKEDGTGDMEDATPRGDDEGLHTRIKKPPAETIASSSATKRSTRASKTSPVKAPTTSSASKKRGKSSTKYKSAEFIEDSDVD
ncbi:hypothetical protein VNI00_011602 [Paramarasmius palmivorus]|uniref:Uncharacterized protein n=1 Tax=Paramarasmius palmivorus TaxID=297713 RepID=A0AAW0CAV4_9AGAR